MKLNYEEYSRMLNKFDNMHTPTCFPTVQNFDQMEQDPERWISFVCYLEDHAEKPKNKEEEYSLKNMREFIKRHLEVAD